MATRNLNDLIAMITAMDINQKRVNSSYGSMDIDVPQDRKSTFEPQIVKKRQEGYF